MEKSERLFKSERARQRRAKIKEIVGKRLYNLYAHLHKLKLKKHKQKFN
tara:strand:+ start:480 stop:626 length:147 start_codon:yes stop_codon:yes gene_type:complete